jgi:hypothetical protein
MKTYVGTTDFEKAKYLFQCIMGKLITEQTGHDLQQVEEKVLDLLIAVVEYYWTTKMAFVTYEENAGAPQNKFMTAMCLACVYLQRYYYKHSILE